MADTNWPVITVVTPSFNQGQYLERAILSVIGQNYPALDYIVMDGGSTDQSVEIIKKYQKQFSYWQSQKDGGQSAAINAGFARGRGTIFAWLNSDDTYLPGALFRAAQMLDPQKPQLLAGNCLTVNEAEFCASASDVRRRAVQADLRLLDYLIQPSVFWTRAAWEKTGPLDASLHYTFDWDWFIRAQKTGVEFLYCDDYLAYYRVHAAHKTGTGGEKRDAEVAQIYSRHVDSDCARLYSLWAANRYGVRKCRSRLKKIGLKRFAGFYFKLRYAALTKNLDAGQIAMILAAL